MSDEIAPHKRNLLAISLAHIALTLSGGHLDGASMLGGSVRGADTGVLMVIAWLVYLYFLWMYWRNKKEPLSPKGRIKLYSERQVLSKQVIKSSREIMEKRVTFTPDAEYVLNRKWFRFHLVSASEPIALPFNIGIRIYIKNLREVLHKGENLVEVTIPTLVAGLALLCLIRYDLNLLDGIN